MKLWTLLTGLGLSCALYSAQIITPPPTCPAGDGLIPIDNQKVLHWKKSTKNQYKQRGHVSGRIVAFYDDRNDHKHFSIQIGKNENEVLEVIYNEKFGRLPNDLEEGMQVQACGDYITSIAKAGHYPASPDGAIIHWIHMNPKNGGHEAGYLMINGRLYGQDGTNADRFDYE